SYDPPEDERFSGTVDGVRVKVSTCAPGDQQHRHEATTVDLPRLDVEALQKLDKNKQRAKKYDAFLASESLIKQILRILGPGLNRVGQFPFLLMHNKNSVAKVKSTIKFPMKKVLCLDELVYHIHLAINFLVSLLKNWQNMRVLYTKSTAGKPQCLYSAGNNKWL
uniref:Ribosomal protein L10a n=1 Tax=Crocodylus porosus TaxID=8502 RepID=A0A7M4F7G3_CROPO